jgi:hypothetical protein
MVLSTIQICVQKNISQVVSDVLFWKFYACPRIRIVLVMLEHSDFSVVAKNRGPSPKPWRWEIHRAGRRSPIACSAVYFETVTQAKRAGAMALTSLLSEYPDDRV